MLLADPAEVLKQKQHVRAKYTRLYQEKLSEDPKALLAAEESCGGCRGPARISR
jgi:hypothetical protein